MLWESSEAPLAQAIFERGEPVEEDALAHLQLIYATLYGLKIAVLRLADEIDELKARL